MFPIDELYRIEYFTRLLMENNQSVILVGPTGCGKRTIISNATLSLDKDVYHLAHMPFNYYTTSENLQAVLERNLEKKVGRIYAPKAQKKLLYCIQDFNVPHVDIYGTTQAHTIIRQHLDQGIWYDRHKLKPKEIQNCQYVASMDYVSGATSIDPRLLRHFCLFSMHPPSTKNLQTIFGSLFRQHLLRISPENYKEFRNMSQLIISSSIALHQKIRSIFLPSAFKFHYIFTMRDIVNVYKGMMLVNKVVNLQTDQDLLKLWIHESCRAYGDKMADKEDLDLFKKLLLDVLKRDMDIDELNSQILLNELPSYCHFKNGVGGSEYERIDKNQLRKSVQDALDAYNDVYPPMDLVLFDDALSHLCRISRILESGNHGILVGVGGSGKQSSALLAAYLGNSQVFQVQLRSDYSIQDFKNDFGNLCIKAGVKNVSTLFLLTDAHIADETFLMPLNDFFAAGEITELFSSVEIDDIVASLRSEVKSSGILDNRENCWKYFAEKVKKKLKVVLCLSPVGNTFRSYCRKFPSLLKTMQMNWFHPWTHEAQLSVSEKYLSGCSILPADMKTLAMEFFSYAYSSVQEVSCTLKSREKRCIETTPKNLLQHLRMYQMLLITKNEEVNENVNRLTSGLQKLIVTGSQADELKIRLAEQEIELQNRHKAAETLLADIECQTREAAKEQIAASEEESKVSILNKKVLQRKQDCIEDLARAEPALQAAKEALGTLNKSNLTELHSFGAPPPAVRNVAAAVLVLTTKHGKMPKDLSWRSCKLMMSKLDSFLDSLLNFEKENIPDAIVQCLKKYIHSPEFRPEVVAVKSQAAAGLCSWVLNILKYYEVYCDVEPKRSALTAANADYTAAKEKLDHIQATVEELENRLSNLRRELKQAIDEKKNCETATKQTNFNISLANCLLCGLASEQLRWRELVESYKNQRNALPTSLLFASAFVSYLGFIPPNYRKQLLHQHWVPFMKSKVEISPEIYPDINSIPTMLVENPCAIGHWIQMCLPRDEASIENAIIFNLSCQVKRWPLVVDPQLQAILWIKNIFDQNLQVTNLHHKNFMEVLEDALTSGKVVLIENVKEFIDPMLQPLIACDLLKKGKFIRVGGKEIPFHPTFCLILHTTIDIPCFGPEIHAQTTVIDFTVNLDCLSNQFLSDVVSEERPELEKAKNRLCRQNYEFVLLLKKLEDSLLMMLTSASGKLSGDVELVEKLEETKETAEKTQEKMNETKETEVQINLACDAYRPVAVRAALCYFAARDLQKLNTLYIFSLKAFKEVFHKAIESCEPSDTSTLNERIELLVQSVTLYVFSFVNKGLYERDKLTFAAHVTFQILRISNMVSPDELEFLLQPSSSETNVDSPVEFISSQSWTAIRALGLVDCFVSLEQDIESFPKRWLRIMQSARPEKELFPQGWRGASDIQKLCILKCLRPENMTAAIKKFVSKNLGQEFFHDYSLDMTEVCLHKIVIFILSPGIDPLSDIEAIFYKQNGQSSDKFLQCISMGYGQEDVAMSSIDKAIVHGHWVVLQNVHLVQKWFPTLERKLEEVLLCTSSCRLFLTADSPDSLCHSIQLSTKVLEMCLKVVMEPPKGLSSMLHASLNNFSQDFFDFSTKKSEFHNLIMSLCSFHAIIRERQKYGPLGWNKIYPFGNSDLLISANLICQHMEDSDCEISFNQLIFLLGEIMYGGHITDERDRKLCLTYLKKFFTPRQLEKDMNVCGTFAIPYCLTIQEYHKYIDDHLAYESPRLYGLHPNAEICSLADTSSTLLSCLQELQPSDSMTQNKITIPQFLGTSATTLSLLDERALQIAEDIQNQLPLAFDLEELYARNDCTEPFTAVGLRECQSFNNLLAFVHKSLCDFEMSIKGEIPVTDKMENLGQMFSSDVVPKSWAVLSYPPIEPLTEWFLHFLKRHKALEKWVLSNFLLATSIWLGGFFSPQSVLTALLQFGARTKNLPLDQMCLQVIVTSMYSDDVTVAPKEGIYISGLYLEGARWNTSESNVIESKAKELLAPMPVIHLKPVLTEKLDIGNPCLCPVYSTRVRADTFVCEFPLPTTVNEDKWILAGVALLLNS